MKDKKTTLPFSEVFDGLKPRFQELDDMRSSWREKEKSLSIFPIAGAIMVILGLAFFKVEPKTNTPDYGMLVLIFVGLLTIVVGLRERVSRMLDNKDFYKDQLMNSLVNTIDPSFRTKPNSFIEKITFLRANFFPHTSIGQYEGKNLIMGKRGDTDFRFCEIKVHDEKENGAFSAFKGLFFEADFHKHFEGRTIIKPKESGGLFRSKINPLEDMGAEEVVMEDLEFENNFTVYSTDQVEARYILSMRMMRDLNELRKRLNCKIYASFYKGNMYLAIDWNKGLLAKSWTKSIRSQELVKGYYNDLNFCFDLVDALNLNTRIWSKRPGRGEGAVGSVQLAVGSG